MDSSSDEDIVKKKGWAVVNEKGSLENSSDEEQLQNVAEPHRTLVLPTCQDNAPEEVKSEEAAHSQSLSPLTFQLPPPESPTLQTPGSNSSSGSTLVSSLPSPQPHLQRDLPINKVEVDLSSVADILKSKVEKEDSQSVDSFEILSESASGDCEPSPDCQSEEGDDESLLPPPSQNIPHRFTSDSESDFVRLKAPSDMDSAHSGLEEITPGPSQSSKEVSSSPEPVLPIGPRPVNAPYQDMRGTSSEEDSDHVRIMSRRWPTEDGGFLLVQRFKKLEPDDISTVSSSISDFSSFSMMGSTSRQRLISDTQEEAGESDTESEASYSSYASEEPLPVNMMVQNVPPAVRQYLHKRNEVFNSKLTIFAVLVLTAGLTLGIGHFVGSSQMVSHHESVQEGQKLRLRSLQDELVSCMDRKKEIARLYQEKEKEVHHCAKEKDELVKDISSAREMENSWTIGDNDLQELRLCSGCSDAGLRYSKFCNTRCPADSVEGHSWVAMEIRSSTEQEYAVNGGSDGHGFEPGQVAPIYGMHNVVQGSEHKMPNYASSVIRSFDNFVAPQAPVSALGGEVVLPGESPHLSKGSISDPVHSTTINDESEESSVQSSPQNEESEELANHFASADEENEAFTTHFTLVNENDQKTPASFSPHSEGIQDLPGHSLSLDGEDEETDSAKLVTYSENLKWEKTESQKDGSGESISVDADIGTSEKESVLHLFLGDDALEGGDSMAFLLRTLENDIKSHASIMDRTSGDSVSLDVENVKDVQTIVTEDKLQTKKIGDATFDTDAKWVCVDEAEPEHCQDWIPKAEVNMNLEQFEKWEAIHTYKLIHKQKVRDEVHQDTVDKVNEQELQSLDKFEPLSVDDNARETLEMNGGEKLSERAAENSGRNNEEKKGDASMKDEGTVVGEMEETLEGEEAWIWTESEEWVSAGSEGNEDDAILGTSNSEEQTDEKLDEQEDHKNGDQQTDQFDVITNALQSAWGIVENASRDIIGTNVSLKDASDIVKERVGELKEVVGDAWDSVQTVASRVNVDHIQPMVKKVNKFVKSRWSEKGSGRSCRGKHCKGGRKDGCRRHGNVNSRRARKTDLPQRGGSADRIGKRNKKNMGKNAKKVNIIHQPAIVTSRNVEEQESTKLRSVKRKGPTSEKTKAVVTPKEGNEKGGQQSEPKPAESNQHVSYPSDLEKPSDKILDKYDIHTEEVKREHSSSKKTEDVIWKRNVPESGKMDTTSPPPVLNIEKVLDSMDMSCGGEVRCVENHKIDAARLLKEMISYRQWLWEQRFRKDMDEVEDFMEELEEFIDEEDVDDEDIEDLKDEFEDMVEDIQKTTKKFFRKQERQTRQKATNSGGSSRTEKVKGKQSRQRLQKNEKDKAKPKRESAKQDKKEKVKRGRKGKEQLRKDVDDNKPSSKGTRSSTETLRTVTFDPNELPSVQMQNYSSISTSDIEDEQNDEERVSLEAVVMPPLRGEADKVFQEEKKMGGGYINTDEWFFRRAHDRQRRRRENPDASWYFERFHSWEEERKSNDKNDWYFQRGRNREESRDCPTQPWHCEWAHDESVVTLWEMYKWLTERFTIRADLRAWELEDQINWFLKKP